MAFTCIFSSKYTVYHLDLFFRPTLLPNLDSSEGERALIKKRERSSVSIKLCAALGRPCVALYLQRGGADPPHFLASPGCKVRWWSSGRGRLLQEQTETLWKLPVGRGKSPRNLGTWVIHDFE